MMYAPPPPDAPEPNAPTGRDVLIVLALFALSFVLFIIYTYIG